MNPNGIKNHRTKKYVRINIITPKIIWKKAASLEHLNMAHKMEIFSKILQVTVCPYWWTKD